MVVATRAHGAVPCVLPPEEQTALSASEPWRATWRGCSAGADRGAWPAALTMLTIAHAIAGTIPIDVSARDRAVIRATTIAAVSRAAATRLVHLPVGTHLCGGAESSWKARLVQLPVVALGITDLLARLGLLTPHIAIEGLATVPTVGTAVLTVLCWSGGLVCDTLWCASALLLRDLGLGHGGGPAVTDRISDLGAI